MLYYQILCLLLFYSPNFQSDPILKDQNARFQIYAPGEFLEKYEKIDTDLGNIEVFTYYYQPDGNINPNFLYLINYFQYPDAILNQDSMETVMNLFEQTNEESITVNQGSLIYESHLEEEKYPTFISRIENNKGHVIKNKMLVFENRFYFLQVYTLKENSLNQEMDRFLDSFRILEE